MFYDELAYHVICGREIEFTYKNIQYFVTDYQCIAVLEDCTNHTKIYFGEKNGTLEDRQKSREQMLCEKEIDNKTFKEVFNDIFVQCVL